MNDDPGFVTVFELAADLAERFRADLTPLHGGNWEGGLQRIRAAVAAALKRIYKLPEHELLELVTAHVSADGDRIAVNSFGIAARLIELDAKKQPPTGEQGGGSAGRGLPTG